jgi:murein DD-endopeptidase MepM/ murein hydrolase activator NlpD
MPRIPAFVFAATLAAWLALAPPAVAGGVPDSPARPGSETARAEELLASNHALPPEKDTVTDPTAPPASAGTTASARPPTLPHRALAGWVREETSLPEPRFSLGRPFTEEYRQSPESTYLYGSRGNGRYVLHTGVDIMNPMGTPVRALADGQVVYAGNDSLQLFGPRPDFYGNLVVTRLDAEADAQPIHVLFGHLDKILVAQGQRVKAGDLLGLVGMTGIAIGPHLHLEIREGDWRPYFTTRNPVLWLSSLPGRGTLAGKIVDESGRPVAGERLLIYRAEEPGRLWRVVRTYLDSPLIHSDDGAAENFALPDMPAGDYRIVAGRSGASVQIPVRIEPGRLTFVEIKVRNDG